MSDPKKPNPGKNPADSGQPADSATPPTDELSVEQLLAQADSLANELRVQLSGEPDKPPPPPAPPATNPDAPPDSSPDPIQQVEKVEQALARTAQQIGTTKDQPQPTGSPSSSTKASPPHADTQPARDEEPPLDLPPKDRLKWLRPLADKLADKLAPVHARLAVVSDLLMPRIEVVLATTDRPFHWVPVHARAVIGYLAIGTLAVALLTLAFGPSY